MQTNRHSLRNGHVRKESKCLACRAMTRREPVRKPWLARPPAETPVGSWATFGTDNCYRLNRSAVRPGAARFTSDEPPFDRPLRAPVPDITGWG